MVLNWHRPRFNLLDLLFGITFVFWNQFLALGRCRAAFVHERGSSRNLMPCWTWQHIAVAVSFLPRKIRSVSFLLVDCQKMFISVHFKQTQINGRRAIAGMVKAAFEMYWFHVVHRGVLPPLPSMRCMREQQLTKNNTKWGDVSQCRLPPWHVTPAQRFSCEHAHCLMLYIEILPVSGRRLQWLNILEKKKKRRNGVKTSICFWLSLEAFRVSEILLRTESQKRQFLPATVVRKRHVCEMVIRENVLTLCFSDLGFPIDANQ